MENIASDQSLLSEYVAKISSLISRSERYKQLKKTLKNELAQVNTALQTELTDKKIVGVQSAEGQKVYVTVNDTKRIVVPSNKDVLLDWFKGHMSILLDDNSTPETILNELKLGHTKVYTSVQLRKTKPKAFKDVALNTTPSEGSYGLFENYLELNKKMEKLSEKLKSVDAEMKLFLNFGGPDHLAENVFNIIQSHNPTAAYLPFDMEETDSVNPKTATVYLRKQIRRRCGSFTKERQLWLLTELKSKITKETTVEQMEIIFSDVFSKVKQQMKDSSKQVDRLYLQKKTPRSTWDANDTFTVV